MLRGGDGVILAKRTSFELEQIRAPDAPGAADLKSGDNPPLAPPPDGHAADPQIGGHFAHGQQLAVQAIVFARS